MGIRSIILLLTFCVSTSVFAKRAPSAYDIVSRANTIGIWKAKDIKDGKLAAPSELIHGEASVAVDYTGLKLKDIITRLKAGEDLILMFDKYSGKVSISYFGIRTADKENIKSVKDIIDTVNSIKKWHTLSKSEQVKKADYAVKGRIIEGKKRCPVIYHVEVKENLKGSFKDKDHIRPSDYNTNEKEHLIFIKKAPGTWSGYIQLKSIPLKDAGDYLKLLQ